MKNLLIFKTVFVILLFSCDSNTKIDLELARELTKITEYTAENLQIEVYAEAPLFVGYNRITLNIQNLDGEPINTEMKVVPMMDMMTMSHSCPLEVTATESTGGKFEFATVFVMPSGEMGSWSLNLVVNGSEITIPIEVILPEHPLLRSFVSAVNEEVKYFVALVQPQTPEVGTNDIQIAVYQKASMMDWPAVENLAITMEPWMVSMDHGSPNNIAPVHKENGHYMGTVNFTMTGDWQVRLDLKEGDEVCGSPFFDLFIP